MVDDEIDLLDTRIAKKEKLIKEAAEKGDKKAEELYLNKLALLKAKKKYIESGGNELKAPDDPGQIEFDLKAKKTLLADFKIHIKHLPQDDVDVPLYQEIENILKAQVEYLSAKYLVITENRPISELSRYIRLTESEGVDLISSGLEHEADVHAYKPKKVKARKKEFHFDLRKIPLIIAVIFLLFSVYIGTSWRKTPYDREIIRSYVVARNYYISGNNNYMQGNYESSVRDYAIAAAYFNKASKEAQSAAATQSGRMRLYFDYKGKFFIEWEKISLKMVDSSNEFKSGDHVEGADLAQEAVTMAERAMDLNELSEEAWSLI